MQIFSFSSRIVPLLLLGVLWSGCGNTIPRQSQGGTDTPVETPIVQPPEDNASDAGESNQSVDIPVNITSYMLDLNLSETSYPSQSLGMLNYRIADIYSKELIVPDAVERISFSADGAYVKFLLPDGTLAADTNLSQSMQKSSGEIAIKTMDHSGTTKIHADAYLRNGSGTLRKISREIPIVIERNAGSSMAIIPYGTTYDSSQGLYIEDLIVQVVDQYGNKVKDGTYVNVGVVNNPILYSNAYEGNTTRDDHASIDTDKHLTLDPAAPDLSGIHTSDKVVLLANAGNTDPLNLGGWSIDSIDSTSALTLFEQYSGPGSNRLSYVIGNDRRFNSCKQTLANAAIYTPEGTQVKNGVVKVQLRYGPYMVGKAVFVYANSVVNDKRIGISRRVDLLGTGLNNWTFTCTNDTDQNKTCTDDGIVTLKDAGTNARNVNFSIHCDNGGYLTFVQIGPNCSGAVALSATVPAKKSVTCTVGEPIVAEAVVNQ